MNKSKKTSGIGTNGHPLSDSSFTLHGRFNWTIEGDGRCLRKGKDLKGDCLKALESQVTVQNNSYLAKKLNPLKQGTT
jgi:hypothetical protein